MSADGNGSITYFHTPKHTPKFRVLAAIFFVLSAWLMLVEADGYFATIARVAGLLGFLCFGACMWLSGRRKKRRHSVYLTNHDGFSLTGTDGKISLSVDWAEVQGISATEMGYAKAISFAFRDPDAIKARMTPEQRDRAQDNEASGLPTLTIPQYAVDTPIEEILAVSQRFFFAAN